MKNTSNGTVTLIDVIAKVKHIAEVKYDGKVYDHILSIFNGLNTREKRVLLRGLINICFIVEDKVLINSTDLDDVRNVVTSNTEQLEKSEKKLTAQEETNRKEMVAELLKLRKMILKALVVTFITLGLGVVIYFSDFEKEMYEQITKVLFGLVKFVLML